jgi:hypothetical protein
LTLRWIANPANHRRVEDWEQFFQEKSRRRADKERRRRRHLVVNSIAMLFLATIAIAAAAYWLR